MARNLKTQNTLNKLKKKSPYASLTDVVNDLNVLGTELDSSVKVTSSAQGVEELTARRRVESGLPRVARRPGSVLSRWAIRCRRAALRPRRMVAVQ